MPASNGEIRGDLHERQMAESDADERLTSAWLLYDIATATEAPRQAVAILQYGLLACALIGLLGSIVMAAQEK
jgi:hypothetical protein